MTAPTHRPRGRTSRPDAKVQRHTLVLRPAMWEWVEERAREEGVTVNVWIENVLIDRKDNDHGQGN